MSTNHKNNFGKGKYKPLNTLKSQKKDFRKVFKKSLFFSVSSVFSVVKLVFLFSVFSCHASALASGDDTRKIHKLKQEVSLLESELKAAAKPAVYAILNIESRKIYLKIKGVILKEFNIAEIKTIGIVHFNGYYSMVKRKAIFPPKRIEIKPHRTEEKENLAASPQEAIRQTDTFGIEDMPSNYTLIFNEGLSISVSPIFKDGFFMSVLNQTSRGLRYIWNSSCKIWNYFKKTPFIKIQIALERDDARALYWSLPDNVDFIVIDSK